MTDFIDIDGSIRPRDDLGVEQVDADLLILDKRSQKIHKLNATASAIWMCLQDGKDLDGVVQAVVEKFDITPAVAMQDVTAAIKEFRALNLLESDNAH